MTCDGDRAIARIEVEELVTLDGLPDRKVVVTRDCGHTYFWGGKINAALPNVGDCAMHCWGPDNAVLRRPDGQLADPAIFDERKRPVKYR